jgi:hypothetical protein
MAKKQSKPAAPAVEILEPEAPELKLVETDGQEIGAFIRNIASFFRSAMTLETAAKATLVRARELQPPTTAEEDESIQLFIKAANTDRKKAEEHWSICQVFSGVHRKLTAARGRTTTALEDAASTAQRLHNRWREDQERIARAEQDRIRREAEERARQERERELRELEQKAIDAEEASTNLSEREQAFVACYATGPYAGNGVVCAQRAGFKDAMKSAARLISLPKIQSAIRAAQEADVARAQAAALREQPIETGPIETVKANIIRSAGSFDRSTWTGEVVDETQFVMAVVAGRHGIPIDTLQINPVKLNEYARSLHERLDLWPGVRAKKSTRTV